MATISKRGDKYRVQIRRQGQAPVSRTFHHKKDAQAWAREMELKADRYDLPTNNKVLERSTLAELVERYRDTVSPRKKGHEVERIVLNAFLRHPICRKTIRELRTADFGTYRDHRLITVKPTTLKRELNIIHDLFEVARREWGFPVRENPIADLGFKAQDYRRERRLREGEFDRLIRAARSCRNSYVAPIIVFAVETGMRRGEILNMRSEHYDARNRFLLIPHSKNGHARTIPLSRAAAALLEGLPQSETLVFPITSNAFRLAWDRLKKRAGIADLHFHDLRHEAISRFFELGLTTPEVAVISGHRDMRMLFRYTHPLRERIAEKVRRYV